MTDTAMRMNVISRLGLRRSAPGGRPLLLAAVAALLISGCSADPDDLEPIVPAAQAREQVPALLETATAAFNLPTPPAPAENEIEEQRCDDRAGQPDPDNLIRVFGGRQIPSPAGDSEQQVETVSASLATANNWSREKASVGSSWRLRTPEGYMLVLRPVSPELMTISIASPCARP
jgi:hypothetical protein